MNVAEEVGIPPLNDMLGRVQQLDQALTLLLPAVRNVVQQSYVDMIGFAFLLKETPRFQDILLLVSHGRLFSARSLLRGLWESRIKLKYVLDWSDDKETAAEAYGLYMDYEFAEQVRKSRAAPAAQLVEAQQKCETYRKAFEKFPQQLRNDLSVDTRTMCERLDKKVPMPKHTDDSPCTYLSDYDMLFRPLSSHVHGGLGSAQEYIDWMDHGMTFPPDEADDSSRFFTGAAYVYIREIAQTWRDHSPSSHCREMLDVLLSS